MLRRAVSVLLLATTAIATAGIAAPASAANSAPTYVPFVDTVPEAKDIPYPGTITLRVDATDLDRGIINVREQIPVVNPGHMVLLYPKWLPGNHAPRGPLANVASLVIKAGNQVLTWKRDAEDMYALHLDVPAGTKTLDVSFQFLSPTQEDQGRVIVTQEMLNLQWDSLSFYPAGYYVRRIPVSATAVYPAGWKAFTALRPASTAGNAVTYGTVNYEVLVDSPVFAGKYYRSDDLGHGVSLDTVADSPKELAAPANVIKLHANLVDQALKAFGARHFDHYDILNAITDRMSGIGLEHHRSSENQNDPGYFTDWAGSLLDHNLIPHEFSHSWAGKYRRGYDLWTPDYRTPMRNSLLWAYEGLDQFWGHVLEARSGMTSKQDKLDALAAIAASLDNLPARQWRSLDDTTNDPIISARRPKGWLSNQRNEDYYNEGLLIWLEANAIIDEGTHGAKNIDDFARAWFGMNDGDYGELTFTQDDVVKTLNSVYPYDWAGFLNARLTGKGAHAPLDGITRGGYTLSYSETASPYLKAGMKSSKTLNLFYSLGLNVKAGKIVAVLWDSPAFNAGLSVGQEIAAINGITYSDDAIRDAVTAAKGGNTPIRLTIKRGNTLRDVMIPYYGGLRYPVLVKTGTGEGALDRLLAPR